MPHKPGHTNRNAAYKVYGTNEPYSGMTVEVGGYLYSTVGGALEGNSMQLIATAGSNSNVNMNQMSNVNTNQMSNTQNDNPVTRTFISRTTYYRQDGTPVPSGAELHQHQDGTIMLGHDPNNMGAIVTSTPPDLIPDFNIVTDEMTGAVPETVPPLPDGTCPVGYNLTPEGNCVHKSGNYGFRPTGGSGNSNTNQGGGGSY